MVLVIFDVVFVWFVIEFCVKLGIMGIVIVGDFSKNVMRNNFFMIYFS